MLESITINTHSSIRIEIGKTIYVDPFNIEKESADADIILITHDHYDHFSPEAIHKIAKDETLFVCPAVMSSALIKNGISENRIVPVQPNQHITVYGISIEVLPAYNIKKAFHPKDNAWVGYLIATAEHRIFVAGDTDFIPEHQAVRCDIAMVPVGGTYTMDAEEAAQCVNCIHPKYAIPTHYGSIVGEKVDGKHFIQFVDPSIQVIEKLF